MTEPTREELVRRLAARERTLAKLVERVEGLQARKVSSFTLLTHNTALEEIVAKKTVELEQQRSELAQALSNLQLAQTRLLQAQKLEAIGQLAAGIAHEINTPAQYVSDNVFYVKSAFDKLLPVIEACRAALAPGAPGGAAEVARDAVRTARVDQLAKQVPRALDQAIEGLSRISTLVAAMKSFAHPSGGVKQDTDLNEAIEAAVTVARNEWKYAAEVTTELDRALPLVPCLRDEISQVVLNLVVNAAHAIEARNAGLEGARGHIRIQTSVVNDHAVIAVEDDGGGIPEAIRHRIFEPFFTTKPVGKGTGQGLAICRTIVVEQHQGSLEVESELGRGSTFLVRLPLGAAAGLPQDPSPSRTG